MESFCQAGERRPLDIRLGATSSSPVGSTMSARGFLLLPGHLPGLQHRWHPGAGGRQPGMPRLGLPWAQGGPGSSHKPWHQARSSTGAAAKSQPCSRLPGVLVAWVGKENPPGEPHVLHGPRTTPRGWAGPVARGLHPTLARRNREEGTCLGFWEDVSPWSQGVGTEVLTRSRALTLRWRSWACGPPLPSIS